MYEASLNFGKVRSPPPPRNPSDCALGTITACQLCVVTDSVDRKVNAIGRVRPFIFFYFRHSLALIFGLCVQGGPTKSGATDS